MSFSSLSQWLKGHLPPNGQGRRAAGPRRFVPELTALEDRTVPSTLQAIPFNITGGGLGSEGLPVVTGDPAPHDATGTATHLGKYSAEGEFQLDSFDATPQVAGAFLTGKFSSAQPVVFRAANGDKLAFNYSGTFALFGAADGKVYAVFTATFTPDAGATTGRFTKYTGGSFVMEATTEPFVLGSTDPAAYTWHSVGDGSVAFNKGKP